MKYKLLALDIDDTIVQNLTDEPSQYVREAIQKAAEKVTVSLVTARAKKDYDSIVNALGCPPAYHVIENGSRLISPTGEVLYDLHIPRTEIQEILDITSPYFDEVGFCVDSQWHLDQDHENDHEHVNGLSFTIYDPENAHLFQETLKQLSQQYNVFAGRHWEHFEWSGIIISHKEASKGKGLHNIQKKLGIKPEETIAVGDAAPDLAMFEYAGLKVAMENGEDQLKEKADVIAPSVEKDGVVEIIHKYILEDY